VQRKTSSASFAATLGTCLAHENIGWISVCAVDFALVSEKKGQRKQVF
jgi:hypothetical protein